MWLTSAEWNAVWLSVIVSSSAVILMLPLGIATAWMLARWQFRFKILVETLVNLPLVVPPVVTGYVLLHAFGTRGFLGNLLMEWFGVRVVFDWKGAALASGVMAFPLMVRASRVAFSAVDPRLEAVARTLGASRLDAFVTVTIPLAWHGMIAGMILAFARSMGEFGATMMVAGSIPGETRTISLEIFHAMEAPGGTGRATALVMTSVLIGGLAVAGSEWLERRYRHDRERHLRY
ncbi:MAG: molybdate ABC transporter permease subunit [Phycisphaerae bacterium]